MPRIDTAPGEWIPRVLPRSKEFPVLELQSKQGWSCKTVSAPFFLGPHSQLYHWLISLGTT